jgi:hypothetical protein
VRSGPTSPATLEGVPRWEPLDPDFVEALRLLGPLDLPYAEQWRRLRPVAARLGVPRPTYWRVRRTAIRLSAVERVERAEREARRERVLRDLLAGLVPRLEDVVPGP